MPPTLNEGARVSLKRTGLTLLKAIGTAERHMPHSLSSLSDKCSSLNRAYCTLTARCMWLCSQVFLGLEAPCGAECLPPLRQLCAWAALRGFGVIKRLWCWSGPALGAACSRFRGPDQHGERVELLLHQHTEVLVLV